MPSIYGNCFIEVPSPVCDPCNDGAEMGGIRGIAFIHRDAIEQIQANPSNAAIWDMLRQDSLIFIIPETRGTFDGGEVITRPGFGNKVTANVGFTFTLEYDDPSYKTNCAFYNQISQSGMYHIAFITETQVKISSKPVEITPTAPVTDSVEDQAVWHIIATWVDKLQPCPSDYPADIFECIDISNWKPTLILGQNLNLLGMAASDIVDRAAASQIVTAFNGYVDPDSGAVITLNNLGGDIAFLISQPYDVAPVSLPKGADMRVYGTYHYYGLSSAETESNLITTRGKCGTFSDGVSTTDTSRDCECQTASPVFHDTLEKQAGTPILMPGKIYYLGAYVKAVGMLGSFTPQLIKLEIGTASAEDPLTPCTSDLLFDAAAVPTSEIWTNP